MIPFTTSSGVHHVVAGMTHETRVLNEAMPFIVICYLLFTLCGIDELNVRCGSWGEVEVKSMLWQNKADDRTRIAG